MSNDPAPQLNKSLSTAQLWGIAVGLAISGEYLGWSYGWAGAGTLGFLVHVNFIALMYTTLIFSFTELPASIPHAGGPFEHDRRAFGLTRRYIANSATLAALVLAPPRPSRGPSAHTLRRQLPGLDPKVAAVGAYLVFMTLSTFGVQIAAAFELAVTLVATFELLVFIGVVGILAIFSDEFVKIGGQKLTANIVAMSVFSARP